MIKIVRRIVRETAVTERGKPLVVQLHPGGLIVRLKSTRQRWPISYESILWLAVKVAAEAQRAERMTKRKRRH